MDIKSFSDFVLDFNEKKELTFYEHLGTLFSETPTLLEVFGNEEIAYKNDITRQTVRVSHHYYDNPKRWWWSDFDDEEFTDFASQALETLNVVFLEWMEEKYTGKEEKFYLKGLRFSLGEEFAFINRKQTKGWITSLRKTKGNSDFCNSFCITTVLNTEAPDARHKDRLKIVVAPNHKYMLHNYLIENVTVGKRNLNIIYI